MTHPFREPQIPPREVRRILRRAAELAESDTGTTRAERTMTKDELERVAGELGIPASSVARAIDDQGREDVETGPLGAEHSVFLGAPTRLVLEAEVAGEPSEADREDVIEEIRDAVGQTGSIESVGRTLVWSAVPGYRRARDLSVRLRSRNGKTRIVVEERLGQQAGGLFAGFGFGGGLGPMGGYIALFVKLGAMAVVVPLLWIPLMLLLARTIYIQLARRRARTLTDVMKRLQQCSTRWSAPAPRLRVGAGDAEGAPRSRANDEAGADREEEEAEADDGAAVERARRA